MAQVHPAVRAVDHSWLRVLLRAVVACRGTLPLPRQQVPQLLVGREHAGQGGMHRLQGVCGRWPGAGSMVAVGAQELILRVHVQGAKGRGNRSRVTVCMGNWSKRVTYCSTEVCISKVLTVVSTYSTYSTYGVGGLDGVRNCVGDPISAALWAQPAGGLSKMQRASTPRCWCS